MLLAFVAPTQNTPFLQYLKAINPSRANLEIQANIPVRGRRTDVHSPSTRPRSQGRRVCFVTSAATLLLIPHRGHHSRTNEHRPDRMDHRVPIPVWAVDRPIVTLVVLEAKESAQWRSVLEAFLFRHPIPLTATQPFTRCPPSSSSCPTPHTTKRLLQPASPCPHRLTRGKSEKKKICHNHPTRQLAAPTPTSSLRIHSLAEKNFVRSPSPYLLGTTAYPLFASYY